MGETQWEIRSSLSRQGSRWWERFRGIRISRRISPSWWGRQAMEEVLKKPWVKSMRAGKADGGETPRKQELGIAASSHPQGRLSTWVLGMKFQVPMLRRDAFYGLSHFFWPSDI